jgi:hypothetical protein
VKLLLWNFLVGIFYVKFSMLKLQDGIFYANLSGWNFYAKFSGRDFLVNFIQSTLSYMPLSHSSLMKLSHLCGNFPVPWIAYTGESTVIFFYRFFIKIHFKSFHILLNSKNLYLQFSLNSKKPY